MGINTCAPTFPSGADYSPCFSNSAFVRSAINPLVRFRLGVLLGLVVVEEVEGGLAGNPAWRFGGVRTSGAATTFGASSGVDLDRTRGGARGGVRSGLAGAGGRGILGGVLVVGIAIFAVFSEVAIGASVGGSIAGSVGGVRVGVGGRAIDGTGFCGGRTRVEGEARDVMGVFSWVSSGVVRDADGVGFWPERFSAPLAWISDGIMDDPI